MIDVVLDTNVLVAALLSPDGEHARVLMRLLERPDAYNLVVSSQIMEEYRDVLGRSIVTLRGLKPEADALLDLVEEVAEEVVPKSIPALVLCFGFFHFICIFYFLIFNHQKLLY